MSIGEAEVGPLASKEASREMKEDSWAMFHKIQTEVLAPEKEREE
jgi:hypothetical protein